MISPFFFKVTQLFIPRKLIDWAGLLGLLGLLSCQPQNDAPTPALLPAEPAVLWGQQTLKTMTKLTANTPTYGSRALGFMGLTMYESVVNGSDKHRSLAGQLSDLTTLPKPESGQTYNWVLVLNAGQATTLRSLYDYADKFRQFSIDSLEYQIQTQYSIGQSPDVVDRSVRYGRAVANALFAWSKTDGGYQGYLKNFDGAYVFPTGVGNWVPPTRGQSPSKLPLHPYWGQNRTFAKPNNVLPVPAMLSYSTDSTSINNIGLFTRRAKL